MAIKDKIKWDKKYQETPKLLELREPSQKLQQLISFVKGKKALDVACGAGKNSLFLAKHDFNIDAMDISQVALDTLNSYKINKINTHLVDLEEFIPTPNSYDLIVKTNYLDRALIPHLIKALKKEGIIYIETYMNHTINEKPPSNPLFMLEKEELKSFFDENFELIEYDEFENDPEELYTMMKQSIIVKKQ